MLLYIKIYITSRIWDEFKGVPSTFSKYDYKILLSYIEEIESIFRPRYYMHELPFRTPVLPLFATNIKSSICIGKY